MDTDLISRSALLADIGDTVVISARNTTSAELRGAAKITDRIAAAPAVDAVEVVRCKDCKHWMYEYDDVGLCVADVPDIGGVERTALNFCSIGERRDDDP